LGDDGIVYEWVVLLFGYIDLVLFDVVVDVFVVGDGVMVFWVVDCVIEFGYEPRCFVEDFFERLRDLVVVSVVSEGVGVILCGVFED